MVICLIAGLMKSTPYKMNWYFPKPYQCYGDNIKTVLDLSNYWIKSNLKRVIDVHIDLIFQQNEI